ncbi:hypothetical protein JW905_16765 [bacterium]|nr:hypothetical protein [candidate division CSSED10-310 bacterium]
MIGMPRNWVRTAGVLGMLLVLSPVGLAWDMYEVCPGIRCDIALDPDGNPAFAVLTSTEYRFCYLDGDDWLSEGFYPTAGDVWRFKLAFASDGTAGIVHRPNEKVFLSRRQAGVWDHVELFSYGYMGPFSFDFNSMSQPGAAIYERNAGGYSVHVKRWTAGGWIDDVVQGGRDVAQGIDLEFDGGDQPHVVFMGAINVPQYVIHGWHDGTAWTVGPVSGSGDLMSGTPSIDFRGNGTPVFAYITRGSGSIHYLVFREGTRPPVIIDTMDDGSTTTYPNIEVDAADNPGIVYRAKDDSTVRYAYLLDGVWSTEVVVSDVPHSIPASLTYDRFNHPLIGYSDGSHVYYAVGEPGAPPFTPTPAPTMPPTALPTTTPSAILTPNPTAGPTGTPVACGVQLIMPAHHYEQGDPCRLDVRVFNYSGIDMDGHPLFIVLDLGGMFWCAPGWHPVEEGIDYYTISLPAGDRILEIIDEFTWPDGAGSYVGVFFHAAITDPDVTTILGEMSSYEFAWN